MISMGIARSCLIEPGDEVRKKTILSMDSPEAEGCFPFDRWVAGALPKEGYKLKTVTVKITNVFKRYRMAAMPPYFNSRRLVAGRLDDFSI